MVNHNVNLATKNNKFKFEKLNKYLNTLYSICTYLKSHQNNNKWQHTEPTKFVPIRFVELKIKQEKDNYIFLKTLFKAGAISFFPVNQQLYP